MVYPIGCFRQWCIIGGDYMPHMVREPDRSNLWIVSREVATHAVGTHEVATRSLATYTVPG